MPRNVRNFWITTETDDSTSKKPNATGPRTKGGGFTTTILVRHEGSICDRSIVIWGRVDRKTGDLVVEADVTIDGKDRTIELSRTVR